jgi:hypothetical protein
MKNKKAKKSKAINDWNTPEGRRKIVRLVVQHLRDHPEYIPWILDYGNARQIVQDVGQTVIPQDVSVFVLPLDNSDKPKNAPPGEKGVGGALILEIPPASIAINSKELLTYTCTYPLWETLSSKKRRKLPLK